jgi:hypothetical protein
LHTIPCPVKHLHITSHHIIPCCTVSCNVQAGDTPLTIAAKENCVDVVLKLLEHGADVNAKDKVRCLSVCVGVCLSVCVCVCAHHNVSMFVCFSNVFHLAIASILSSLTTLLYFCSPFSSLLHSSIPTLLLIHLITCLHPNPPHRLV